jgi:hypothetical protein
MHGVAVEPRRLELAHDHADVLLAEVLFAVTRKRAGFMANGLSTSVHLGL